LPDLVAAISELRHSAMLRATRAEYAAKSVTHANGLLVNFEQPGGQFLESSASPTHSSPLPRRTSFSEVNAGFWQNLYQGSYGLQG
jgi:hypothetical protein